MLTVKAATSLETLLSGGGESGDMIEVGKETPVTDTAILSGTKAAEATGTVKYFVYADSECEELVTEAGEVSVSGAEAPPSEAKVLEPGIYYWQAEYSGDAVNSVSISPCGSEIEVVAPLITTVLSGGGLSGDEIEVLEGTDVSDQATLHGAKAAEATGTVKYFVYADSECEELVTEAGEVNVEGALAPPSDEVELEEGTYYWQAEYSGDGKNPAATSGCEDEISVVVTPTALTTSLSGGGEEGKEIEVEEGTAVSDQASLTGANAENAEGFIEYSVYADSKCTDFVAFAGAEDVKEGVIPASDELTLPEGTYYWQAEYSGDGVNGSSISPCGSEIEVVSPAPITTELSGGEYSGNEIEVPEGTPVQDQATLHGPNAAEATGTVEYNVYADSECEELVTEAGEVTVEGALVPPSSEVEPEEGVYYWQAVYSGDGKNPPAVSACGSEELIVADPPRKYAGIGDSFSSGEGIGNYYGRTNQWGIPFVRTENMCHRSREAWPSLVATAFFGAAATLEGAVLQQQPNSFIFRACSGAVLDNLWSSPPNAPAVAARGGQYDEFINPPGRWLPTPAQDLWLELPGGVLPTPLAPNRAIKLVTLTISGNDARFAAIVRACIQRLPGYTLANCQAQIAAGRAAGFAAIENKLPVVLNDIHISAPMARIRMPLYPQILHVVRGRHIPVGGPFRVNNLERRGGMTAAQSLSRFVGELNGKIAEKVKAVAKTGVPVKVIPGTVGAFRGHQLGDAMPWVNGVVLPWREESVHPNRCGHIALARRVMAAIGIPAGAWPALC